MVCIFPEVQSFYSICNKLRRSNKLITKWNFTSEYCIKINIVQRTIEKSVKNIQIHVLHVRIWKLKSPVIFPFHIPVNRKILMYQNNEPKFNQMLIIKRNHIQSKKEAHQISQWKLGNLSWHSRWEC